MVFARKADAALASLVKEINQAIKDHKDTKIASFVNIMGPDRELAEKAATEFAQKTKADEVAIAVPVEFENGPADFGIKPEAEVTVMLYKGTKVQFNHALRAGKLDKAAVAAIAADIKKLVE